MSDAVQCDVAVKSDGGDDGGDYYDREGPARVSNSITTTSASFSLRALLPAFTERVDGLGEVILPGTFPLLGRLFGDKAFDMGGRRFETFVSNTPTPRARAGV
mgnify:CR=1 FL=1